MSPGNRVPLELAQNLSTHLVEILSPSCEKIKVVGSVRRCKPLINDVEVIALARESHVKDLFGETVSIDRTSVDELLDHFHEIENQGWRIDSRKQNKVIKRLRHIQTGLIADLYVIMDRRAWGSYVVIRTGPRPFAKYIISAAYSNYMHFDRRLLLHNHAKKRSPCWPYCAKIIPLIQESDVFEQLKITYISPVEREKQYGSGI